RWISPAEAAKQEKSLLCPKCSYDLRGLRSDRCPECGKMLTQTAVRQAENKRDGINDSSWYDPRAVLFAIVGLVIGGTVWGIAAGSITGVYQFAGYFGITVVIGWVVFFVCSVMWIGFDQPLRKTVVQIIGAYGLYSGVASVLELIPLPGIITFFIAMAVLVSLLSEMLDIDLQDAIVISLIVIIVKVMLMTYVFYLSLGVDAGLWLYSGIITLNWIVSRAVPGGVGLTACRLVSLTRKPSIEFGAKGTVCAMSKPSQLPECGTLKVLCLGWLETTMLVPQSRTASEVGR
ncbi:hypothetical protein JYS44_00005, partial [Phycisphaeraceae bacterium AH-315-B13]|nr:hypothetical protein [Phycisphaeraceae bacterium AH-315-B13]